MRLDELSEDSNALARVHLDNFHTSLPKPVHTALEGLRLPDDDRPDVKLDDKAAAIPARGQGSDHDLVAVAALTPRLSKRVGFTMDRRVVLLNAAIVAAPEYRSIPVEECRPDRNPAFTQAEFGLFNGHIEHRLVIKFAWHMSPDIGATQRQLRIVRLAAGSSKRLLGRIIVVAAILGSGASIAQDL